MSIDDPTPSDVFCWSADRAQLTVTQDGDLWTVVYRSDSPLFGPRHIVYEGRHKQAKHAAFDVLNRVSRITHDDEEGVRVAQNAARWMKMVMWGSPDAGAASY